MLQDEFFKAINLFHFLFLLKKELQVYHLQGVSSFLLSLYEFSIWYTVEKKWQHKELNLKNFAPAIKKKPNWYTEILKCLALF